MDFQRIRSAYKVKCKNIPETMKHFIVNYGKFHFCLVGGNST